jgi:hypothetical protein
MQKRKSGAIEKSLSFHVTFNYLVISLLHLLFSPEQILARGKCKRRDIFHQNSPHFAGRNFKKPSSIVSLQ